jgi:hypothetical protein
MLLKRGDMNANFHLNLNPGKFLLFSRPTGDKTYFNVESIGGDMLVSGFVA